MTPYITCVRRDELLIRLTLKSSGKKIAHVDMMIFTLTAVEENLVKSRDAGITCVRRELLTGLTLKSSGKKKQLLTLMIFTFFAVEENLVKSRDAT